MTGSVVMGGRDWADLGDAGDPAEPQPPPARRRHRTSQWLGDRRDVATPPRDPAVHAPLIGGKRRD
ncbi:MAG: hypothetical protein KY439_01635 [Actinobacteria bacterium]|nr:hypothetical protein [Actinomycetota bacterium]